MSCRQYYNITPAIHFPLSFCPQVIRDSFHMLTMLTINCFFLSSSSTPTLLLLLMEEHCKQINISTYSKAQYTHLEYKYIPL